MWQSTTLIPSYNGYCPGAWRGSNLPRMRFSVLSSGSRANCTFVESGNTRLLIDCGLSASRAAERLFQLGIDPSSIDALLVTHEHSDHICGVPAFSRKFDVPVFVNRATREFVSECEALEEFVTGENFCIGSLSVSPFSVPHDASDPVGFVVRAEGAKFVQCTDLGRVTRLVEDALSAANAVVIEANHDEDLLRQCGYPWVLKQRILSSHGHISNHTAGALLNTIRHPELFHVVLGHLSENSNTPDTALETVKSYQTEWAVPDLLCGSVSHATPLIEIGTLGEKRALSGVGV